MGKYTKKQLTDLAAGAFKCSPNEAAFYASENGTFLNESQYNKLSDEDKKAYTKIDNPNLKEEAASAPAKGKKESAPKVEAPEGDDDNEEGEEAEPQDEGMKVPAGPKVPKKGAKK